MGNTPSLGSRQFDQEWVDGNEDGLPQIDEIRDIDSPQDKPEGPRATEPPQERALGCLAPDCSPPQASVAEFELPSSTVCVSTWSEATINGIPNWFFEQSRGSSRSSAARLTWSMSRRTTSGERPLVICSRPVWIFPRCSKFWGTPTREQQPAMIDGEMSVSSELRRR